MKRVLTAAILIPLVILALFKAPLWLFTLLVFGVAVLAANEYFGIVKAQGFTPYTITSYVLLSLSFCVSFGVAKQAAAPSPAGIFGVVYQAAVVLFFWGLPLVTVLAPLLYLLVGLRSKTLSQALPDAAVSYMVLPYVGFTLGALPILQTGTRALFLLFLMILVWCGDIAAYYVGRAHWQTQARAPDQSREILGRGNRLSAKRHIDRLVVISLPCADCRGPAERTPADRKPVGIVGRAAGNAARLDRCRVCTLHQCLSTTGRFGRISPQAWCRGEGFRDIIARSRRCVRPS